MYKQMIAGCGRYCQGDGALSYLAESLTALNISNPLVLAGHKSLSAVKGELTAQLDMAGGRHETMSFAGPCSYEASDAALRLLKASALDGVIAIGGGSCIDAGKLAAVRAGVPVITIPTCASTCAATSPLSAMYHAKGGYIRNETFSRPVDAVLADTRVIANAPVRLLASGIADSFAKFCEYSCPDSRVDYRKKPVGLYSGYMLSLAVNEVLFNGASKACRDCEEHAVTEAVEDVVFAVIGLTGTISGLGAYGEQASGGRFAFAHTLNEVFHSNYPSIASRWLHGEVVGVGILAQVHGNGNPPEIIDKLTRLFAGIGLPVSLSALGFPEHEAELQLLIDRMMLHGHLSDRDTLESSMRRIIG